MISINFIFKYVVKYVKYLGFSHKDIFVPPKKTFLEQAYIDL